MGDRRHPPHVATGMSPSRSDAEALDAADPLAAFRDLFELGEAGDDDPARPIYLDGNSLGRLPKLTRARLADAVEEWGSRLIDGWQDWYRLPVDVGDRLAATVLGSGAGRVAATDSTTVNLYKLADAALDARP